MGFCYFPSFYKDELLYSLFSRYHTGSGNGAYSYTAKELFSNPYTKPAVEFMNQLTPEAIDVLTRNISLEEVILDHTMFPEYARFARREKRKEALLALKNMEGNLNRILPVGQRKTEDEKFLRYCPLCAEYDRKTLGETYWHRVHQLRGIKICPNHHCLLQKSIVPLKSKNKPELTAAEHVVPFSIKGAVSVSNAREIGLAVYTKEVFIAPIDMKSKVMPSEILCKRINELYMNHYGIQRNFTIFLNDYQTFFSFLENSLLMDGNQIQRVLSGKRINHHEICQLAFFVELTSEDIVRPNYSIKADKNDQIFQKVSDELNIDRDIVELIGKAVLKAYKKNVLLDPGPRDYKKKWDEMDRAFLPEVKKVISALYREGEERPRRVTINAVTKELGFPQKRFDRLPRCKAEIISKTESQAEYWAREVAWAYHKLVEAGKDICWTRIRELTNMRRKDFIACQPFLDHHLKEELCSFLSTL